MKEDKSLKDQIQMSLNSSFSQLWARSSGISSYSGEAEKITAYQVELAQAEAEIGKLLDTLTGANSALTKQQTRKREVREIFFFFGWTYFILCFFRSFCCSVSDCPDGKTACFARFRHFLTRGERIFPFRCGILQYSVSQEAMLGDHP